MIAEHKGVGTNIIVCETTSDRTARIFIEYQKQFDNRSNFEKTQIFISDYEEDKHYKIKIGDLIALLKKNKGVNHV